MDAWETNSPEFVNSPTGSNFNDAGSVVLIPCILTVPPGVFPVIPTTFARYPLHLHHK